MTSQEITQTFSHKFQLPEDENVSKITILIEAYQLLAHTLNAQIDKESREKSIAITKLQESFLFAKNTLL